MKIRRTYALLSMCSNKIENMNIPACKNCIYYIPSKYNTFDSHSNMCGKYGKKDIISDKIIYEDADKCRKDENKCGFNANDFEKEPYVFLKTMKHSFTNNFFINTLFPSMLIGVFLSSYLYYLVNR